MYYINPVNTRVFTRSVTNPSIPDPVEEYISWKASYSKTAHHAYRIWVERFQHFVGKQPEYLTLLDVTAFLHSIKERYAQANVQYGMNIVHNYLRFFYEQGRLQISPFLIRVPKAVKNSHRAITEGEYQKILSVLDASTSRSLRDTCILRLLHDTGMRVGELCSLDVEDMDEDKSAVIQTEKTVHKRTVFWNPDTEIYLHQYLIERVNSHSESDALFVRSDDPEKRLCIRSIQRIVAQAAEKAGLENISPHSFRHGFIHRMAKMGTPDAIIAQLVGHSTPHTVSHYTKLSKPELKQAFSLEAFCRQGVY